MNNTSRTFVIATLTLTTWSIFCAQEASAQYGSAVSFTVSGVPLSGVLYTPVGYVSGINYSAVIMMHGCSGMWSNGVVGKKFTSGAKKGTPDLQNHIEKWGWELAARGIVALAVDSYTPRWDGLIASTTWQNQCYGTPMAGAVDPYVTRVADIGRARTYLIGLRNVSNQPRINANKLALLGWSQGAEGVFIEAAATPRLSNSARNLMEKRYVAAGMFYPGTGSAIGFKGPGGASYWRPWISSVLSIGDLDSYYSNCQIRANTAISVYASTLINFNGQIQAAHSFDQLGSGVWPTSKCGNTSTGDDCAMRDSDIDTITLLTSKL